MKSTFALCITVAIIFLNGCESANRSAESLAASVAPPNPVTGKRLYNTVSEDDEIKKATEITSQVLQANQGRVDTDAAFCARLRNVLTRLTAVAHRQNLPWEVHLIATNEVNAFTIGGGKIFFFVGINQLIDTSDENEIATVLAHEIGHCAYRHPANQESWNQLQGLTKAGSLYHACFTTIQEDEADRVSTIYLALAGFDPTAAWKIWGRAQQKLNTTARDWQYRYTHPLNADRARSVKEYGEKAKAYYLGPAMQNPQWEMILKSNSLIEYRPEISNGWAQLIQGAADSLEQQNKAMAEKNARKIQQMRDNATQDTAHGVVTIKCGKCFRSMRAYRGTEVICPFCGTHLKIP